MQTTYGWEPEETDSTAPLYIKHNAAYAYLHYDDLGTPFKATDSAGKVVWSATYDSFGSATIASDAEITVNLRFPGQYYDSETGLHYNDRRYYDPAIGRYITQDPLGLEAGQNLYLYVEHDPANLIDPTGEIAPVVAAYGKCVLQCAGETCLIGLLSDGSCNPCAGAGDCFLSCLNPLNWITGGKAIGVVKALGKGKKATPVVAKTPRVSSYKPPPRAGKGEPALPGFPKSKKVGNRGGRASYDLGDGTYGQWDSQEGEVEVYDRRGRHIGSYDPHTGQPRKPRVPGRTPSGGKWW